MNNCVDLTGMAFNVYEHTTRHGKILFFRLSISKRYYDENNELQVEYDNIDCAISKRKNQKFSKRYDYLKENLTQGSLIRVKGKLGGKRNLFLDSKTKKEINVLTNIVWIKNYKMLNKKNEIMGKNAILVGKRIRRIRIDRNKTMEEFADLLDSHKSNVSRWERGVNMPNIITLEKIAVIGEISVNKLLYGVDDPAFNPYEETYKREELNNYYRSLKYGEI